MRGQNSSHQRTFAHHSDAESKDLLKRRAARPTAPRPDTLSPFSQPPTHDGALIQRARGDPSSLSRSDVIHLQRLIGNRVVVQLLRKQAQATDSVQRLPTQLESAMDTLFGGALADVHVHAGAEGDHVARTANTDAVAIGDDIFFREGAYRPGTSAGNAVIAREVTHVQQRKTSGSASRTPSTHVSDTEKEDAEQVGGLVRVMDADPTQTLQPVRRRPTAAQRRVIQRDPTYSHSRTAGIVTSKVVQGIFTTVLGPLGLVWRWPLIQKNIGEAMGTKVGTRQGKADDKLRYGGGKLGEVLRFLSVYGEVLKELVIWLGFASFIAAIVAAATHGVAAPVFVGLGIMTAMTGGVLFLVKSALVALNGYRLHKAKKLPEGADKNKKLAHIKHQMVTDGLDAFSALLTTVFAGLGAGGVTSAGSALANAAGVSSSESASKLASSGMTMATQGLATSVIGNTLKEGGKDAVKPGGETGFFGKGSTKKDDWGGFGKDAVEIKNAYKPLGLGAKIKGLFSRRGQGTDNQNAPDNNSGVPSPDAQQALTMTNAIVTAGDRNAVDQGVDSQLAKQDLATLNDVSPTTTQAATGLGSVTDNLKDVETKSKDFDPGQSIDTGVKDEGTADNLIQQVNQGLQKANEAPINTAKKPSLGSRIGGWFATKLGGLRKGIRRLNNWLVQGVINFTGRFAKTDANPKDIAASLNDEKRFAVEDIQDEEKNDELFGKFQANAHTLDAGINALVEKENR